VPKNESNSENQLNPHTPLPTIGLILPIAGGSSMEFETKKQKKGHLRLVNIIAV
jgi:anti-sigma regulatory factor (Ser/Thr protein kinase)